MLQSVTRVRHMRVLEPHNVSTFVEALIKLLFDLELIPLLMDEAESELAPNSLKAGPECFIVLKSTLLLKGTAGVASCQNMLRNAHALQLPNVRLEGCKAAFDQVLGTEYSLRDCR